MNRACIGFEMDNAEEARIHMDFEIIENYGDEAYGHILHTWDDGERMLARCRKCGGYILIQKSEFHSFSDDGADSYYTDYFPVNGTEEVDELNRKYDGFALETSFPVRFLCETNGRYHWSR